MRRKLSSCCFIENRNVNDVNVKIYNRMIERVQLFNFLGIMLNGTLSWKSHIAMVSNKVSKVIGILYRLNPIWAGGGGSNRPAVCFMCFSKFNTYTRILKLRDFS